MDETEEDVRKMIDIINKSSPNRVRYGIVEAYIGTDYYNKHKNNLEGIIYKKGLKNANDMIKIFESGVKCKLDRRRMR